MITSTGGALSGLVTTSNADFGACATPNVARSMKAQAVTIDHFDHPCDLIWHLHAESWLWIVRRRIFESDTATNWPTFVATVAAVGCADAVDPVSAGQNGAERNGRSP